MSDDGERKLFGHMIDVTLTEAEMLSKLERIADIDRKMIEVEGQKAVANQGFNSDLKDLKKERLTHLEAHTAGKAKIEISCYLERDDRRGMMLTLRADNGELVDERALTAEEREEDRQGDLFDAKNDAPPLEAGAEDEEGETDEELEATLDKYSTSQAGESSDDEDLDAVPGTH